MVFPDYQWSKFLAAATLAGQFLGPELSLGDDNIQSTSLIQQVPLYTKKSNDMQPYADIGRGFKMLR
jgi:hypothetical protein